MEYRCTLLIFDKSYMHKQYLNTNEDKNGDDSVFREQATNLRADHRVRIKAAQTRMNGIITNICQLISEDGSLLSLSNYSLYEQMDNLLLDIKHDLLQGGSEGWKLDRHVNSGLHELLNHHFPVPQTSHLYSTLEAKQLENTQLHLKKSVLEKQLSESKRRVSQLQQELNRVGEGFRKLLPCMEQNQVMRNVMREIREVVDRRESATLNKVVLDDIDRVLRTMPQQLEHLTSEHSSNYIGQLLRLWIIQLYKLWETPGTQLSQLLQSISSLCKQIEFLPSTYNYHYHELPEAYEQIKQKYEALVRLIKRSGRPELQTFVKRMEKDQTRVDFVDGWICLTPNIQINDYEQMQTIHTLISELQQISRNHPQVQESMSSSVIDLLQTSVLDHPNQNSIKTEVVVHQPALEKTEDKKHSYYDREEDQVLIEKLRQLVVMLNREVQLHREQYGVPITIPENIHKIIQSQIDSLSPEALKATTTQVQTVNVPLPVPTIVEKPIQVTKHLESWVPTTIQKPIIVENLVEKPVEVQVPVILKHEVPVKDYVQKFVPTEERKQIVVEVPEMVEKIVPRLVVEEKMVETVKEVPVPYRQEIKEIIQTQVEKPLIKIECKEIERPVEITREVLKEVERKIQTPIYLYKEVQYAVQIPVIKEKFHEKPVFVEIEKKIPYIITKEEPKQIVKEIPQIIVEKNEVLKVVPQVVEKVVQVTVEKDTEIKEVEIIKEKPIIKQIEKQIFIENTHFVKGDRQHVYHEQQILVEKPIVEEKIVMAPVEIQKVVPLHVVTEKTKYIDIKVPCIETEYKPVEIVVEKPVILKEQIVKEIIKEVPVPVIVEKEVVRVQKQIRQKVVEKVVEVPRVQIVEKIVEKVVIVPRIVETIVEVPVLVEKVIVVEEPILQIAQIHSQIPVQTIIETPKFVETTKEVAIQSVKYKEVEKQIPVEVVVTKEVAVQVELEKRVPWQLIKEVPVELIRQKIVEKLVQTNNVIIKDRQVQIPFTVEKPVQVIEQKPIVTQKLIENIVKVPLREEKVVSVEKTIEKPVEIITREQIPVIQEVLVEVPGETIIQYQQQFITIELKEEKVVQVKQVEEIPRQVHLQIEKIVPIMIDKFVCIPNPELIPDPIPIPLNTPIHHVSTFQKPIIVEKLQNVPIRTIIDSLKEVETKVQKIVSIQTEKQQLVEVIKEVNKWCREEVEKYVNKNIIVDGGVKVIEKEIQVEKVIEGLKQKIVQIQKEEVQIEKVVERVVMLPQIVQIFRNAPQPELKANQSELTESSNEQIHKIINFIKKNIPETEQATKVTKQLQAFVQASKKYQFYSQPSTQITSLQTQIEELKSRYASTLQSKEKITEDYLQLMMSLKRKPSSTSLESIIVQHSEKLGEQMSHPLGEQYYGEEKNQSQFQQLSRKVHQLKLRQEQYQEEEKLLRAIIYEKQKHVEAIQRQKRELQKKITELQTEKKMAKDYNMQVHEQLEDLKDEYEVLTQRYDMLKRVSPTKQKISLNQIIFEESQAQGEQANVQQYAHLKEKNRELNEQLKELQESYQRIKTQSQELKNQHENITSQFQSYKQEESYRFHHLQDKWQGELNSQNRKVQFLNERIRVLEEQMEMQRKDHDQILTKYKQKFKQMKRMIEEKVKQSEKGSQQSTESVRGNSRRKKFNRSTVKSQGSLLFHNQDTHRSELHMTTKRYYESEMTVHDLAQIEEFEDEDEEREDIIGNVMLKLIQKQIQEIKKGNINFYNPWNISIHKFDKKNLSLIEIELGPPIIEDNAIDGLYIPPESHNEPPSVSQASLIFSLGIIWDQLINKTLYFRTINDLKDSSEFIHRKLKLKPIYKNSISEMMIKDPKKRVGLSEVKKRLLTIFDRQSSSRKSVLI